jgi:hypothetical protein
MGFNSAFKALTSFLLILEIFTFNVWQEKESDFIITSTVIKKEMK